MCYSAGQDQVQLEACYSLNRVSLPILLQTTGSQSLLVSATGLMLSVDRAEWRLDARMVSEGAAFGKALHQIRLLGQSPKVEEGWHY